MLQRHTHLFNLQFLYISVTLGYFESRRVKLPLLLVSQSRLRLTVFDLVSVQAARQCTIALRIRPTDRQTNEPTNQSTNSQTDKQIK